MTRAAYDDIADWYEAEFLPVQRWGSDQREYADQIGIDEAIAELLGRRPESGAGPGRCLEVGCGTGIYADRIRSLGWAPIGVDISAGMLGYAVDRLAVARGDAARLPFPPAVLDAAIGVMIHSDMPGFRNVLSELHRVLRPGASFVHIGVHPCFTGDFADRTEPAAIVLRPGYREEGWTPAIGPTAGQVGTNGQVRKKVGAAHYPLAVLLNAIIDAGFQIRRTFEGGGPTPITFSLVATKPFGAD